MENTMITMEEYNETEYKAFEMSLLNNELVGFNHFINEIKKYPILSSEETRTLGFLASCGDKDAREKLILHNIRLVLFIANKFKWSSLDFEDLVSLGNQGLLIAINKFDPNRNVLFHTYAYSWIHQSIQRGIEEIGETIRVSVSANNLLVNIKKTEQRLREEFREEPTIEQIAEELNIPVAKVKKTLSYDTKILSLSMPVNTDDSGNSTLGDFLEIDNKLCPEEVATRNSMREDILNILHKNLTDREVNILCMRNGWDDENPMTFEAIGQVYNITKTRVKTIYDGALQKLANCNDASNLYDMMLAS